MFKLMHEYKHIHLVLIIYCEYLGLLEKRLCMEIYWFVVDSSNGSFLKFVCFIYRMSITPDDQSIVYMTMYQ